MISDIVIVGNIFDNVQILVSIEKRKKLQEKRIKHNSILLVILIVHILVNINVYVHVYVINIYSSHK